MSVSGANIVELTDDRMITVNGEPFFLIGLYDGMNHLGFEYSQTAPRFGLDQVDDVKGVLEEIASVGFNAIRYIPWHGYQQARDTKVLTMMNELGIMAFTSIPDDREVVEWLKQHDAFLMWEIADEPVWTKRVPLRSLQQRYDWLKRYDKDHPVFMNHAPQNSLVEIRQWSEPSDIVGVDIYPYFPSKQGHLPNTRISVIGDYMKWLNAAVNGEKPMIMILQGYQMKQLFRGSKPTYEELRFMAYDAIVNGASGIVFYGTAGAYDGPNWSAVIPVVRELNALAPVLGTPNFEQRLFAIPSGNPDMPIEVIAKVYKGDTYIIAINRSDKKVTAQIEGISWDVGDVLNVCFEERQVEVNSDAGMLIDDFQPYGVHVYSTRTIDVELNGISTKDLKYLNVIAQ